jgi:hypothetical protein
LSLLYRIRSTATRISPFKDQTITRRRWSAMEELLIMFIKILILFLVLSLSAFASNVPQTGDVVQACITAQGLSISSPGSPSGASGASGSTALRVLTGGNNGTNTFVALTDGTTFAQYSNDGTHQFYVSCVCHMSGTPADGINFQLMTGTNTIASGTTRPAGPLYQSGIADYSAFAYPINTITAANPVHCDAFPFTFPINVTPYINDQSGFAGHTFYLVGKRQ